MEKIGLIQKVNNTINRLGILHERTQASSVAKSELNEIKSLAKEVSNIGKTKDIVDVLNTERALLRSELAKCPDDVSSNLMKSSLSSAITDLDNASDVIDIVKKPHEYSLVNRSISVQKVDSKDGLPKDAFHRFIDSHKSRLANRIKLAETNFEERLLLSERHKNMDTVKKEYMKLQAIALNIPSKENSKEIER